MGWEKVTVDSIIDTKEENRATLGKLLETFDRVMCVFNEMKAETIKLDNCLQHLLSQSISEGALQEASVAYYNTLLVNFGNTINTYLALKLPSESGIAANVIKAWSVTATHYTYKVAFKLPEYSWIPCSDACAVDNVIISNAAVACPELTGSPAVAPDMTMQIGCSLITIPQYVFPSGGADADDYAAFKTLLCSTTQAALHQYISHLNKNLLLIEKCINHVNNLIQLFELL